MTGRERILRAGASIVAGLVGAWEHLTDRDQPVKEQQHQPEPQPAPPPETECPFCGDPLHRGDQLFGPCVHTPAIAWPTEHPGAVLLTNLSCGVIGDYCEEET